MPLFQRGLVWTSFFVTFALLEWLIAMPYLVYLISGVYLVYLILAIWQITGRRFFDRRWWRYLPSSISTTAGIILLLIFSQGDLIRHFYVLIASVATLIFFNITYLYIHRRPQYQPHALENISSYVNILALYLIISGLFSFKLFFVISIWPLLAIMIITSYLLNTSQFSLSGITWPQNWRWSAVIVLVSAEIFVAVSLLPTSVYVNAIIVTLLYYAMTGISRNWLLDIRERRVVQRYSLISLVIFFVILLTAKWI